MLVVSHMVPGGPAENKLRQGDVLLRLNGKIVTHFADLEAILDDSVGEDIEVEYIRFGAVQQATVKVQDLHAITPNRFVEAGGSIFHDVSYHQARNYGVDLNNCGVIVSLAGHALRRANIPHGSIIQSIGDMDTPNLEYVAAALRLHVALDCSWCSSVSRLVRCLLLLL